jgi:hypothetical protein
VAAWCIQITAPLLFPDYSTVMAVAFSDVPIHLAPVLNPLGAIILV